MFGPAETIFTGKLICVAQRGKMLIDLMRIWISRLQHNRTLKYVTIYDITY
jgi:hypothetical protein